MDNICAYLNGVDWSEPNIPLDLVKLKLDHVINELTFLKCVQKKTLIYCVKVSNTLHRISVKDGATVAKVSKAGATKSTSIARNSKSKNPPTKEKEKIKGKYGKNQQIGSLVKVRMSGSQMSYKISQHFRL